MKISNFFGSREFMFSWPEKDPSPEQVAAGFKPIPDSEKIVLHCRRLGIGQKTEIEDNMVGIKGGKIQKASQVDDIEMAWKLGSTKVMRLKQSVFNWENVEDDEGNKIKFSHENLFTVLSLNAGLDSEVYGLLESDLLDRIEQENSFADKTRLTEKNS